MFTYIVPVYPAILMETCIVVAKEANVSCLLQVLDTMDANPSLCMRQTQYSFVEDLPE